MSEVSFDLVRRIEQLAQHARADEAAAAAGVDALRGDLTALRSEVRLLRTDVGSLTTSARAEEHRSSLEERLAALEDALAGLSEQVEALAREGAHETTDRLVTLADDLVTLRERQDTLAGSVSSALGQLGATVDRSLGTLSSSLSGAVADSREVQGAHVDAAVARLAGELSNELPTRPYLEEELAALRNDLADALEEVREKIEGHTDRNAQGIEAALGAHRDALAAQVAADRLSGLTTAIEGLRADSQAAAASAAATAARLDGVDSSLEETSAILAALRSEWSKRTAEVVRDARTAGEAAVAAMQERFDETLAEVRGSLDNNVALFREALTHTVSAVEDARAELTDGTERLSVAGRGLLGYLAERDRALEEERDRIVHDVLDEFATGLSAKERRALSGRVGEALDRRRDSRDAARWREHGGRPLPEVPPAPDLSPYDAAPDAPHDAPSNAPHDAPSNVAHPAPRRADDQLPPAPRRRSAPRSALTPAKAAAKPAAKAPAKAPAKALAKPAAKTPAPAASKTAAKSPAPAVARRAVKSASKPAGPPTDPAGPGASKPGARAAASRTEALRRRVAGRSGRSGPVAAAPGAAPVPVPAPVPAPPAVPPASVAGARRRARVASMPEVPRPDAAIDAATGHRPARSTDRPSAPEAGGPGAS